MARLEPLGIRRGLAFHSLSKELHPIDGNQTVLDEVRGLPLEVCWAAMPHQTGEMPAPDEFVRRMRQAGAKAVRLFPVLHQFSLDDWCAGELLSALEGSCVPVLLDMSQAGYDQIASMLRSHPALRLVLLQPSYRCDHFLYPLLERYEHLAVETSNYVGSGAMEEVWRRFGPRRLVFGTGMPFTEPGAAVSHLTYAELDHADKQRIAAGNLEELLSWDHR